MFCNCKLENLLSIFNDNSPDAQNFNKLQDDILRQNTSNLNQTNETIQLSNIIQYIIITHT